MLPAPVRFDMNASFLPSGEYRGRDSVAGCATSRRASPPAAGAVQMSPPETKAISLPSGDRLGSPKERAGALEDVLTGALEGARRGGRFPRVPETCCKAI